MALIQDDFDKFDLTDVVGENYQSNNITMNKWYNSSSNNEDLSLTIKGILIAWIPMAIAVGQFFDLPLTTAELTGIVQDIVALISAIMVVYGLGRKIYFRLK